MFGLKRKTVKNEETGLLVGCAEVHVREELERKLADGGKVRIKLGFDPTAPDIHLGHVVVLRKLREFQEAGHTAVFIIGDYTARVGDPTGKSKTRPQLSAADIEKNAKTYFEQVGKVVDTGKIEIRYNSEWFAKMDFSAILGLLANFTVARMIERDDFKNRLAEGKDIGMHELLYPVMQAYDSVAINADVEIGGTDQLFNMLAGRELQKKIGKTPQDVITMPLLVGTDGKDKMSKSIGNSINLIDSPENVFGKVMSLSDAAIVPYFRLALGLRGEELAAVESALKKGENPRNIKADLARRVTEMLHGKEAAGRAAQNFEDLFVRKEMPAEMKEVPTEGAKNLVDLIVAARPELSRSEARRLIEQGAVKIDGKKAEKETDAVPLPGAVMQVGKKDFFRLA